MKRSGPFAPKSRAQAPSRARARASMVSSRSRRPRSASRWRLETRTKWDFYYWSENETNREGKTLEQCLNTYGVGGWYSEEKDMVAALVWKSAERDAGNSWLLGIKHLHTIDEHQPLATMYEEDPETYHVPVSDPFGEHITSKLAASAFEKV